MAISSWAIIDRATTPIGAVDTSIVPGTTGPVAGGKTYATRAGGTVAAIDAIGKRLVYTNVALARDQVAAVGGAVAGIATSTSRIETGIAARTAERSVRTARTAGIGGAYVTHRTTLFFGDTDRAIRTTGVVTTLLGRSATVGTAFEQIVGTDAFGPIPKLLSGTGNGFGCGSRATSGIDTDDPGSSQRTAETKESFEDRTARATASECFRENIESPIVHAPSPQSVACAAPNCWEARFYLCS